jgi:hypothetical protein
MDGGKQRRISRREAVGRVSGLLSGLHLQVAQKRLRWLSLARSALGGAVSDYAVLLETRWAFGIRSGQIENFY